MDEHTPHREFVSRLEFRVNMDDKTVQMRINSLRNALRIIFANEMHTLSFCDVYNIVYTLTIGQHGLLVHNVVQDVVSEHARNVDSVDSQGNTRDASTALQCVVDPPVLAMSAESYSNERHPMRPSQCDESSYTHSGRRCIKNRWTSLRVTGSCTGWGALS